MISDKAYRSILFVMRYGCYLKIFPYEWDQVKCQFTLMTKWNHKLLHNFHQIVSYGLSLFSGIRLLLALTDKETSDQDFPPRVAAMNILWSLAYLLTAICFQQFFFKREKILSFGNALFETIRKCKEEPKERQESKMDEENNGSMSKIVILSGIMLIINPPFHSIMMIDTPCAPHFSSSLWLSCGNVEEDSHSIVDKIPFILLETYFAVLMFTPWTFNWTLIYLGLGWIRVELTTMRKMVGLGATQQWDNLISIKYNVIKCITILLNDSFSYYLRWFPTILLGIVSFLLYSCIQFWEVGWRAYGMFPLCLVRCVFESFTPLALAGMIHENCSRLLGDWKRQSWRCNDRNLIEIHLLKSIQKSCKTIEFSAGGLYTFENSIVLTTVNNCLLLTLNLLLVQRFN